MNITAEMIAYGLDNSRRTGTDKYVACCPAHDDNSPSLAIKQDGDNVLVHCFSGCTQHDVIDSLKSQHLWPVKNKDNRAGNKRIKTFTRDETISLQLEEAIYEAEEGKGIPLTELQRKRLHDTKLRIATEKKQNRGIGKQHVTPEPSKTDAIQTFSNIPSWAYKNGKLEIFIGTQEARRHALSLYHTGLPNFMVFPSHRNPENYTWDVDGIIVSIRGFDNVEPDKILRLSKSLAQAGACIVITPTIEFTEWRP